MRQDYLQHQVHTWSRQGQLLQGSQLLNRNTRAPLLPAVAESSTTACPENTSTCLSIAGFLLREQPEAAELVLLGLCGCYHLLCLFQLAFLPCSERRHGSKSLAWLPGGLWLQRSALGGLFAAHCA